VLLLEGDGMVENRGRFGRFVTGEGPVGSDGT
jgi:hypothetical protein